MRSGLVIAWDAAWLRGAVEGSAVDAIHLATARRAGVTASITNARRVCSVARLEAVDLDRMG